MRRFYGLAGGILAACVLAGAAQAQPRHEHYEHYEHMDGRYAHNHYYPSRGYVAPVLPRGYITVNHFHDHFYYSGGIWYRPYGARFVVVAPPVGVFVPVLPPFYTTVWFGGIPYYYANDSYYLWRASDNQYEVVAPPDGSGDSASTQAPPSDDLFIYPKNGQSEDQQSKDRYECHSWASGQSGFDPTKSGGGVAPQDANARRADYNRAMTACLEGRGYSVK
ncbi:MAG TPA: DUF6515 family protein [Steroidobacteraceae bacterium]|nr:DUF6515 family protein [Steroidobacteraceae bacterium]